MSSQQTVEQPWWQKYIDEDSPRSVAVIRGKGMSIWSLVRYYRLYRGDNERVLAGYHGELAREELEAALAYYWHKPYGIDRKLKDDSEDAAGPPIEDIPNSVSLRRKAGAVWKKYIDEESLSVAIIRNKGMSVWSLVRYYRICQGDKQRILAGYRGELTSKELAAAMAYYWANHDIIDRKLWEIST